MTGVTKTVRGELRRIMNRPQTRSFDGAKDEGMMIMAMTRLRANPFGGLPIER